MTVEKTRTIRRAVAVVLSLVMLLAMQMLIGCGGGDQSRDNGGQAKAAAPMTAGTAGVWVANSSLTDSKLYRIDPASNKVVATVALERVCKGMAADGDSLWLSDYGGGKVWRVDAATNKIVATINVGGSPAAIAAGLGSIWVADANGGTVVRIDPVTNKVTTKIKVTNSVLNSVCVLDNAVWVASVDLIVSKIDPVANKVVATIQVGTNPSGISAGFGSLWVGNPMGKSVLRIDPIQAKVAAIIKTGNSQYTAAGTDFIVAANYAEGSVAFVAPKDNIVTATVNTGQHLTTLAVGHGAVWTASTRDDAVYRIDPTTKKVLSISVQKPGKLAVTQ